MMKKLVAFLMASVSGVVLAQDLMSIKVPPNSPLGRHRAEVIRKSGGFLEKPNSLRGQFVVLDAQKTVAATNVEAAAKMLATLSKYTIRYQSVEPSEVADGNWVKLMDKYNANGLVAVVSDDHTPSILVASDDAYAVVNVSKLAKNLMTDSAKSKFLPNRVRRQILRAFGQLGGSTSKYKQSPAAVVDVVELDESSDILPMDTLQQLCRYLESKGLGRKMYVPYKIACQEGWAPAPTNDIQKAIWDKVHTIPSKPIKIEYNEKRDKGK